MDVTLHCPHDGYVIAIEIRGKPKNIDPFTFTVLAHGLVKEREVPPREIEEAIRRKRRFELHPERHTYKEG